MGFVRKHHSELLLLLLPAAGFLVLAIVAPGLVGHEARVIEGACREALAGTTAGRQALVSSCWWAPLPLLAALAPALVAQGASWPVGAVLASALATAGVGVVVWRGIRTSGQGAGGALLLLLALLLNPLTIQIGAGGGLAAVSLLAGLGVLISFGYWTGPGTLRHLVTGAFAYAAATLCGAELWGWMVAVAVWLLLVTLARRDRRSRWHALWLLAFLPCVYAFGVWALMNWLIMGDSVYFVQSLWRGLLTGWETPAWSLFPVSVWGAVGCCAVAAVVGAFSRRGDGIGVGVLGTAAAAWGWALTGLGLPWATTPARGLVLCAGVLSCGFVAGLVKRAKPKAALVVCMLPLLVLGAELMVQDSKHIQFFGTDSASQNDAEPGLLESVDRLVSRRAPFSKVFVCGYDGLSLSGVATNKRFATSMDFHLHMEREAYWGQQLYVLMQRPEGRSRTDSIHWRDPEFFELGARHTLHAGTWGEWRLMEVVTAPTTRQLEHWAQDPEVVPGGNDLK